ncbi:MAG: chitobiase/beta-hexosaminidase C-terminal domain-containing protein [Eubacterium sp.]|nr:chitobiase/beta-hexosaminidase C-terminal domain-containing protein [Eubacterium sp.]
MKCSNCGKPVEEGRLFCMNCGQEIQWVPDYDSFGSYMEQERIKKEQERKRKERAEAEAARRKAALLAEEKRKKKKKRMITVASISIAAAVCILLGFFLKFRNDQKNYNDFNYQMGMAETAFSNHKYEDCYSFVQRAVELDQTDTDAKLLLAQVQVKLEKSKEAVTTLKNLLKTEPDNITAYGQLIKIYEQSESFDEIKELLDQCEYDDILKKYDNYISSVPVFSLPGGDYDELKSLQLYSREDNGTIYFTTDGSDPSKDSNVYTESISLNDGTTTVKAIVINAKGIASDIVTNRYNITLTPPDPPRISPSSGKFTTDMDTRIYIIVPDGCKAYYAFDKKPTIGDEAYDPGQPVEMKMGTHTFYAILVDENGKVSSPGSAIYTLSDPK